MKEEARVTLKVYDVLGREVATLVDGLQGAGIKSVVWDARDTAGVPSGTYFYRIVADDFVQARTMVLSK